ncbi:hypothetical protein PG985_002733 [Apiospora marii]|uniref:uncharacterized protein n=1 Tax=Apiospora marii TaxID=335849 RepID=UPI00312DB015
MLRHVALSLWAVAAWTAPSTAMPTLHARTGNDLVNLFERSMGPQLNFTPSHGSSILHPNDSDFASVTHRWSGWEAPTFSVAFLPTTEQDVSIGLKYMTQRNISFIALSGGHGSSITLKSVQSGVGLSLANMNKVTYDVEKKTITVGGGARYRDIWTTAYNAKRELPLSSACVGVGGCTVGGGHGWLQGKYGLVIDAITSMRVALWDGTIVTASEKQNPDLFWAMRGAGQNFGIMLEFTMKTWPQTNGGEIYNADMSFTSKSLEGVLEVINDIIPTQPADLGMDFVIFTNQTTNQVTADPTQIYLGFVYLGDQAKGEQLAARFADSEKTGIQRTHFNETTARWDELSDVAVGGFIDVACSETAALTPEAPQQQVDVYTANTKRFDIAQTRRIYDSYADFIAQHPNAMSSTVLYEVFAQQAYAHDYVYMNYAHGDEPLEAMYGYEPWRLERLRKLKARYDPHGYFNHFNSVLGKTSQGY